MRMKYTAPEMEIVMFEAEEVIVASVVSEEQSGIDGGSEDL